MAKPSPTNEFSSGVYVFLASQLSWLPMGGILANSPRPRSFGQQTCRTTCSRMPWGNSNQRLAGFMMVSWAWQRWGFFSSHKWRDFELPARNIHYEDTFRMGRSKSKYWGSWCRGESLGGGPRDSWKKRTRRSPWVAWMDTCPCSLGTCLFFCYSYDIYKDSYRCSFIGKINLGMYSLKST